MMEQAKAQLREQKGIFYGRHIREMWDKLLDAPWDYDINAALRELIEDHKRDEDIILEKWADVMGVK